MKDQILKLCKRLNNFTLDEILTISELDKTVLLPILDEFISENKLAYNDIKYCYNKNQKSPSIKSGNLPHFCLFHSFEKIELVMKCFCAEIPVRKVILILDLCEETVLKFYTFFRKKLYETQYEELKIYYEKQPKNPSIRALYDKKICLYSYNGQIYISDKPLNLIKDMTKHTKEEFRKSNIAYYKIRRAFQNYAFTQNVALFAYEKLWMQDKNQEQKMEYLKNLLNIPT